MNLRGLARGRVRLRSRNRRFSVLEAGDGETIPQRIETRASIVEDARAPRVQLARLVDVAVVDAVVRVDALVDEVEQELIVGVVARAGDHALLVDLEHTRQVAQRGHRPVGAEHVGRD